MTLLTAVPDNAIYARSALLILVLPLLAAVFIGRGAVRRLESRNDRMFAAAAAALLAGIASGLLAVVASGGVVGGAWSSIGVPPLPFAVAVTVGLGVVGVGIAALGRVSAPTSSPIAGSDADQIGEDHQMTAEVVQDGEVSEPGEVNEPDEVTKTVREVAVSEPDEDGEASEPDEVTKAVRENEIDETVQSDRSSAPVGKEPDPAVDHTALDVPDQQAQAQEQLDEDGDEVGSDQAPVGQEDAPAAPAEDPEVHEAAGSDAREGG